MPFRKRNYKKKPHRGSKRQYSKKSKVRRLRSKKEICQIATQCASALMETKYITNDVDTPGLDVHIGGSNYPTGAENILGAAVFNITPQIPQGNGVGQREGLSVNMTRWVGRFQMKCVNEDDESMGSLFDPKRCQIRIHLVRAKIAANMTTTKVNRALKNLRPGALWVDSTQDVDKEFRKQFTILETHKLRPRYMRTDNWVIYPATPDGVYTDPMGDPASYNGHGDASAIKVGYRGEIMSFSLSHNFKNRKIMFDGNSPRDYTYHIVFQIGDWTYAYASADERLESFPEFKLWNTYLYKDA